MFCARNIRLFMHSIITRDEIFLEFPVLILLVPVSFLYVLYISSCVSFDI